jgi:glycerophosphoryl diester phosphodiesterase
MAYAQGADYLEQDLVMTRDGQLMVLHDLFLDDVSDVADRFPGTRRADGRHYVIDLTLAQLFTLHISERVDAHGSPRFPNRFPLTQSHFTANTFAQEIELLSGTERSHLGLAEIAAYADNIGVAVSMLCGPNSQTHGVEPTDWVKHAHAHGLAVHVYTLRADQLPSPFTDLDDLHRFVFERVGADGVFSDFPDRSVRFLNR